MAIYNGSRYSTSKITLVKDGESIKPYVHHRKIFSDKDIGDASTMIQLGADLEMDAISYAFYGVEGKWWFLSDINEIKFGLFDSDNNSRSFLSIGRDFIIPSFLDMKELT